MAIKNLDGNNVAISAFSATLADFTQTETYVLKGIKRNYVYVDEKKTDSVESISYDVVDIKTFVSFRLKVPGNSPVIDPEKFDELDEVVKIRVPRDKATVKPYRMEFGRALVSIVAPFVELVDESDDLTGFTDFDTDDGIALSAE